MSVIERDCPRCHGTGQIGSPDSTDDRYWGCTTCLGSGKVVDKEAMLRRELEGAVEALREIERLLDHSDLRAIPDVMSALDVARDAIGGQ